MCDKEYIITIGSANIDIAGYSYASLNYADSNQGRLNSRPEVWGVILHIILLCWVKTHG